MASTGAISLRLPDSVCQLPPELWARVFTLMEPTPDSSTDGWLTAQAAFWQVPLVCKTFQKIFTQHKIGRHVCVHTELTRDSVMPSLLAWLQVRSDVIETLHTLDWWSTQTDECFSAIYPAKTLISVIARPTSVANLEVLARFGKTLQSCHLSSPFSR